MIQCPLCDRPFPIEIMETHVGRWGVGSNWVARLRPGLTSSLLFGHPRRKCHMVPGGWSHAVQAQMELAAQGIYGALRATEVECKIMNNKS